MRRLMSLFTLALLALIASVSPASAQGNLLANPSFDSEVYTPISFDEAAPTLYMAVPEGWGGAVIQSPRNFPWMNVHPTGLPHIGAIKVEGFRSYHLARGGGTFTAYIYQQVAVEPGTAVQGGAWVYIEGTAGVARVGIDPLGGTNPFEARVAWAETGTRYGWSTPTVSTTAESNVVTLFLFATQVLPSDPNGVYWDAAFLNGVAGNVPVDQAAAPEATSSQPILRSTAARLNVRAENRVGARILGIISPENQYGVLEERDGWYRINYGGRDGWVSSAFVEITGAAPAAVPVTPDGVVQVAEPLAATGVTYTTNAPLRIRTAPNTNGAIIGTIPWGLTAEIVGRNGDSSWWMVRYDGITGWSSANFGRIRGDTNTIPVTG